MTLAENFTTEQVLAYAQRLCPAARLISCQSVGTPYDCAQFTDHRGRRVIGPVFSPRNEIFGLRSLLRQRQRFGRLRYLFNGQASTGAVQLAFWGEHVPELLTARA